MSVYDLPRNPRNPNPPDGETSVNIYGYTPSRVLGIVAVCVFAGSAATQLFWLIRYRRKHPTYHVLLLLGSAMEIAGYVFRLISSTNPFILNAFVLQYFLIVCAPVFFSAAIYVTLSSLVRSNPSYAGYSLLGPKTLVTLFVCVDVFTIGLQVAGAALIGIAQSKTSDGEKPPISTESANKILLAGLSVQSLSFIIFLTLFLIFAWRASGSKSSAKPDKLLLVSTLAAALLIFLRTLFRLAESAAGALSDIGTNQTLFACLEALPVFLAVIIWAVIPLGWRLDKQKARLDAAGGLDLKG